MSNNNPDPLSSGAGIYNGKNEEAVADLRESVHEQLDALRESDLSIEGAVASGLVAATDAPALKQIAGKRKGGEIGCAAAYTPPPPPRPRSTTRARLSPHIPRANQGISIMMK